MIVIHSVAAKLKLLYYPQITYLFITPLCIIVMLIKYRGEKDIKGCCFIPVTQQTVHFFGT